MSQLDRVLAKAAAERSGEDRHLRAGHRIPGRGIEDRGERAVVFAATTGDGEVTAVHKTHIDAGSLGRLYEAVQSTLNPRTADAPVAVLQPVPVFDARGAICQEVLESLPEWFGIPASIDAYVSAADGLPMLACFEPAGDVVGFISVKTHTPTAAEVYVMGVKRAWHRRGIGRALIGAAAQFAHCRGARFLTVKTLSPSNPDPNYAATRLFYEALGFLPIEEFLTLWNADNPCLLMLRPLMSGT
jgi:ribosomal protein S18 acetylase RimI-like enzyme